MKAMVCLKQVPHQDARLDVGSDGTWLQADNIKFEINSYDTYALEEALRLKDADADTEVPPAGARTVHPYSETDPKRTLNALLASVLGESGVVGFRVAALPEPSLVAEPAWHSDAVGPAPEHGRAAGSCEPVETFDLAASPEASPREAHPIPRRGRYRSG